MNLKKTILSLLPLLLLFSNLFAQSEDLLQARNYASLKQYDKAAELYKKIYNTNPADADIYHEYFEVLLAEKEFKQADKLVDNQEQLHPHSAILSIDHGRVYLADGKKKKADESFDQALQLMNGDDILTQQVANAFIALGRDDYLLKTYERATELTHNTYIYSGPMARLYAKRGDIEKALNTLLSAGLVNMNGGSDEVKSTMLEMLGNDSKKLQLAQKVLVKKINEQPENPFLADLLTWLYTQKDDYEGALIQLEAVDTRNHEQGDRLLEFARFATKEKQYEYAIKAYEEVMAKGTGSMYYGIARAEMLNVKFTQLQGKNYTPTEVSALASEYKDFLTQFPQQYTTQVVRDYATLEAQYADSPQRAIEVLNKAISEPAARRDFVASCKLQMGDYYVLMGKIWDASLLYSQVDKDFREDMLGEDARFRNAKLYYYNGDFEFAESQLSVLKASTSELIANDALYLSVLITENITPDSNYVPLRRFAHADLLMFQNKDKEAEELLDSIAHAFPQHPLNDDILMQKAKLAEKHHDYNKALDYLKDIYAKYAKDVLGDDAVYETAVIYENNLRDMEKARHFYEQLIIDYPGSTYVQSARTKLAALQNTGAPVVP